MSRFRSRLAVRLFFVAIAILASSHAHAQSGSFTSTGPMITARSQHTATLLPSGQVLIVGGVQETSSGTRLLASTELYDPATGRFTPAANMTTTRRLHAATLLPDGRVLITGGYGGTDSGWGTPLSSAELYDPSADRFTKTGDLITARGFHTAVLLSTGQVLIVGGSGAGTFPDNIAPGELYDPLTGAFTSTGAYVGQDECDFCAPAVLLADGTVLFPGQYPAQLYDPNTNQFRRAGRMIDDHSAAALLPSGKVLFAGGESDFGRSANAELYDPATGVFSATGSMTARRVWHTLTLLPSGLVLAAGGETDGCAGNACAFAGTVRSAELYDPLSGGFHAIGDMVFAHEDHTATLLADGRVLIAGGVTYGGIGLFGGSESVAELYRPEVLLPAPTLVGMSGDDRAQGAIYHAGTTHLARTEDPAAAGEEIDILCTGIRSGSIIQPQVAVGDRLAEIVWMDVTPGVPVTETVRVRVPTGIHAGSVAVRLTYLGRSSNTVTMAVK